MSFKELDNLIKAIERMSLASEEKEELIVRAADLVRFQESYTERLKVSDLTGPAATVAGDMGKASTFFYEPYDRKDLQKLINTADQLSSRDLVDELWFIYVEFSGFLELKDFYHFVIEHSLHLKFDRVFILNYQQSTIQALQLI